ncbi:MAG: UDP-N-acetylglucosamine diphosphorylase/glucosamine-1-phosphate N-acetyltransferase [Gammaproteobacteria bacterium]|nr:UDP-N-acetylglucosamine diphosphorylase/glucosamine-1-phosphate N-acetyltransferase [Gammaproteobacteria bacterium]
MSLSIIILAAGQGTRMRSSLPKILHPLAGRSLLEHVYIAATRLDVRDIHVVYGFGGDEIIESLSHLDVKWVEQAQQLGTGHAVAQAIDAVPDADNVLILYGDVPLITYETLADLVQAAEETGFSLLTSYIDDPRGYGRIVRDKKGDIEAIVEEKDATEEQRNICEINTGMMTVQASRLKQWLKQLDNNNAQAEYYLTDVIKMASDENVSINSINPDSAVEIQGVNNRQQLAELERYYQLIQAHHLMNEGVTLMDPQRFDLRGDLEAGRDVVIDINAVFEGSVSIGNDVSIGPNCYIRNADIGDNVTINANTVIDNAVIGSRSVIGPFARVRPDTRLAEDVHIGNFVEIKKSEIGQGSKINHLSYVGDSEVGKKTNIGAGTITCNYDGANKHKTVIGDDVFVGSDTQLVAPVTVANGVTIAAGTTVTKDVAENMLTISRTDQKSIKGWKRPKKK